MTFREHSYSEESIENTYIPLSDGRVVSILHYYLLLDPRDRSLRASSTISQHIFPSLCVA